MWGCFESTVDCHGYALEEIVFLVEPILKVVDRLEDTYANVGVFQVAP